MKPIQLGDTAPDFEAITSEGPIRFHEWAGNDWVIFFSHPKDFTPVCTTELGEASKRMAEFMERSVKMLGLSCDDTTAHAKWILDINETQKTSVNFPIVADQDRKVSNLYGMLHPNASDTMTVRTTFIIDPAKKVRLMLTYPASTGRNFDELLRVIDSLQLTDNHSVATPVNWQSGDACVILPAIQDEKTLKAKFPKGWTEIRPYLRITPQP